MKVNNSFRDELVTSGLVMAVLAAGTFFLVDRVLFPVEEGAVVLVDENILGSIDSALTESESISPEETDEAESKAGVTPSPSATPMVTPSPTPQVEEIPYRPSKEFENEAYIIGFSRPRLMVGDSRVFEVEVVLENKSVESPGIINRLFASIVKGEQILVQEAVMSVSDSEILKKGENMTFTAKMALIEGTELKQIIYSPGDGLPQVTYEVEPL